MPLVFRPNIHSAEDDYDIVSGGLVIGTLVKERNAWRWYVHGITVPVMGNVRLSGCEADLDQAKSAIVKNWQKWLALAKLKETD
jgi:hypothetical protein